MKIVLAAPHYPPRYIGGTEKMIRRMAQALAAKGHQVAVVCVESNLAEPGTPFSSIEDDSGVSVHRLSFNIHAAPNLNDWSYFNPLVKDWFNKFLKSERPDVVHLLSGYLISGGILEAAYENNIPSFLTLLDFWFVCPLVNLLRVDGHLCSEPVPASRCVWCLMSSKRRFRYLDQGLGGLPGKVFSQLGRNRLIAKVMGSDDDISRIEQRREYLKEILEKADGVVTHSLFLQKKFTEYGISKKNMVYIPNGIEKPNTLISTKANHRPVRIGYLGQVTPYKGVHILIEAYLAAKIRPDQGVLTIHGDVTRWPAYIKKLKKSAKGHPGIVLAGPYQPNEIDRVLKNLDLVVVPSICYENRPTVILEAFSQRIPVIASNQGGMAEIIQPEVDGLLFQTGDVKDLANKLRQIIDSPGMIEKLQKGIKDVKMVSDEINEIEGLYKKVLTDRQMADVFPSEDQGIF